MSPARSVRTVAVTAAVAVAAGCAASADVAAPSEEQVEPGYLAVTDGDAASGGELVVHLDYDTAELSGLDPQGASTARSWMIGALAYETLTTIDADLAVAPGLATSWETPSPTEYVFTLTDDAVFSNGRPMTADDVTGSIQRLLDEPTTWTGQLGPIASVETTGDLEVTVTLEAPYEPFLAALANTPAAVLPMEEIASEEVDITAEMLGTGPLVATSHRQDERWTFEPNEHHPDAEALGFDSLVLRIVGDESTRAAALRDGSADLAILNASDSAALVDGSDDITVVGQRNTDFHYLMINSLDGHEALRDEQVRFAINTAIDRATINDLALAGASQATGITPQALPDACDPDQLPSATASTEDAAAVVEEVGGLELDLLVYTDEPVLAQIAQVIQQDLAEIGVTVTIEQLDYASYSDLVYADPSDFDLALSWFAGYADAAMVTTWWDPEVAGFTSVFMEGSDELDALIADGYATEPGEARAEVFADLCALADQQSEMIALVSRPTTLAWNTATLSPTIGSDEGYGNFLRHLTEFRAG